MRGYSTFDSFTPQPRRWLSFWVLAVGLLLVPNVDSVYRELVPGPDYAFLNTQPGSEAPIAYNPCRPIEFVVYHDPAPPGADGILDAAIKKIATASGLEFAYLGPAENPAAQTPSDPSSQQEPVLIGWATPQDVRQLEGRAIGVGGSSTWAWDADRGEFEYITGAVILDAPALGEMLAKPDGRDLVGAVMMHELAHLLGLDHVRDPDQLMYPENTGRTELAPVTWPASRRWGQTAAAADQSRPSEKAASRSCCE